MNAARKIIALLIILFVGLPALVAIIWTVGLTNAVVSSEFLVDLPQQMISDLPELIDEIVEEGQDPNVISDKNTRAWFKAAAKTGITPKQLMEESGILSWMENELSDSLEDIGDILRGRARAQAVTIDLRPLKRALSHESIDFYLRDLVANFPPCDEDDYKEWMDAMDSRADFFELPPCRPDPSVVESVIQAARMDIIEDMEDDVEVLEDVHIPRIHTFGISRLVSLFSYALFILPVGFLIVGAIIGGTSPGGFFRWLGISLLVGGLIAWGLAFFTHHVGTAALDWAYMHPNTDLVDIERLVLEKTFWFQERFFDRLFNPVQSLAGMVSLIGLVVFIASFIAAGRPRQVQKT